jgi:ribosomal protein S18 acetylase RimI-like enzyme
MEVPPGERDSLLPILEESFEGWYLWHSRRTLRNVDLVRSATLGGATAGLIMLKELGEGVGYVYYVAVLPEFRRKHVGARLLDDALAYFTSRKLGTVYATVEEDNEPSLSLFHSRGFMETGYGEMSKLYGRLRSAYMMLEMQVIAGEVVLRKDMG